MNAFRLPLAALASASTLAIATLSFSSLASAQATGGPSAAEITPAQLTKPPEQSAIDACKGKAEGDRVRFTDAKGKRYHWACKTVDGVMAARSGVATPAIRPKKAPSKAASAPSPTTP